MRDIRRRSRVRSTTAMAAVAVLAATAFAPGAVARAKTSWYSVTASTVFPGLVKLAGTDVGFTVTNCGAAATAPTDCSKSSGPAITDITIALPGGWTSSGPLQKTGLKLAAGASTTLSALVLPTAVGAGQPQAVGLTVCASTDCAFSSTSAALTLKVPVALTFTRPPADTTATTGLCGVTVTATDSPAGGTSGINGLSVGLRPTTGSVSPDLYPSTTVLTSTTGVADLGCRAVTVGGPYTLTAYTVPDVATADSSAFYVYGQLKSCTDGPPCTDSQLGTGKTQLDVSSTGSKPLGTSTFAAKDTHFPAFTCAGVKKLEGRPDVLQTTASGDKTVVITWSKATTLAFTDNGTPHWQVCMRAPAAFLDDTGATTPQETGGPWYVGTLPICGSSFLTSGKYPCMLVSRNQAQEIARITLPATWATGDPYFH
jgi:hypothetical protein